MILGDYLLLIRGSWDQSSSLFIFYLEGYFFIDCL